MALLRILRAGQITLPAELRKQFNLSIDDYVEAQPVKEGILLKPVAVVEREQAWKQVFAAMKSVKDKKPKQQTPQEQEEEITRWVKDFRKHHATP
jgi:AbrB family looped-hinge helix DNA binding protein